MLLRTSTALEGRGKAATSEGEGEEVHDEGGRMEMRRAADSRSDRLEDVPSVRG